MADANGADAASPDGDPADEGQPDTDSELAALRSQLQEASALLTDARRRLFRLEAQAAPARVAEQPPQPQPPPPPAAASGPVAAAVDSNSDAVAEPELPGHSRSCRRRRCGT